MIATVIKLIARRLVAAIPILLIVSALLFCVLRLLPVDPAAMSLPPNATIEEIEAKRREMGLDKPLPQQYLIWLADALHGEFGRPSNFAVRRDRWSPRRCRRQSSSLCRRHGHRRRSSASAAACSFSASAAQCSSRSPISFSVVLLSIPEFLWGLILLFVFGVVLQLLPFTGEVSPGLPVPHVTGFLLLDSLLVGRLDVFLSACSTSSSLPSRSVWPSRRQSCGCLRSSLFDIYHEDYIQQARLRGLSERRILLGHALKNASLPTLTLAGVQFGILFSGTLLVEVIYSYPGMGNLMVDAVRNADLPLIQTIGLTYCVVVLLINTMVDGLYVGAQPETAGALMPGRCPFAALA